MAVAVTPRYPLQFVSRKHIPIRALLSAALLSPRAAWPQNDMIGFDLLALLKALPSLLLHGIGEFLLSLLALVVIAGIFIWLGRRLQTGIAATDEGAPQSRGFFRRRGMLVLAALVIAISTAVLIYAQAEHTGKSKLAPLNPPNSKAWPGKTGRLDMPQTPASGHGTIRITHRSGSGRIYAKLCVAKQSACPGLRHVIVQKFEGFEFDELPDGAYEIRYRHIDRPHLTGKSRPVTISAGAETQVVHIPFEPVLQSGTAVYGVSAGEF